jgi:hypothetical protein
MSNITRTIAALTLTIAASLASGCIVKDVTETWYVDANGAVTWVVQEALVRSDAKAPEDRLREEAEYWLAVQQDRHPSAMGFRELGAAKVTTTALRGEAPYTVQIEARFPAIDALSQRIIAAIGGNGYATLERSNGKTVWTFVLRDPSAIDGVGDPGEGLMDLLNGMEKLRVVLVGGRFESAEGFELSADRRTAVLNFKEPGPDSKESPTVTLRLEWKGGL